MSSGLRVRTRQTARHAAYLLPEGRGAVRPEQAFCAAPAGTPVLLPTKIIVFGRDWYEP